MADGVRHALGDSPTRLYCPKYTQQRSPQNRAGTHESISAVLFQMVFSGFPGTCRTDTENKQSTCDVLDINQQEQRAIIFTMAPLPRRIKYFPAETAARANSVSW